MSAELGFITFCLSTWFEPRLRLGSFLLGAVEFGDFVAVGDNDDAGAIDEEAVFDDARDVAEFAREGGWIGDAAEVAVEDVMALVGDEGLSVFLAEDDGGAELFDFAADERESERDDFDGDREIAEHGDLFAGVGDDDELLGGGGHDFFVEERAAATFDEIEMRVELIGAVDGDVDLLDFVKIGERDAEFECGFAGVIRGGDAADFEAGFDAFADELDGVGGCRAGAKADDLAVFDELDGDAGGGFFFDFVGHGWVQVLRMRSDFNAIRGNRREKMERNYFTSDEVSRSPTGIDLCISACGQSFRSHRIEPPQSR